MSESSRTDIDRTESLLYQMDSLLHNRVYYMLVCQSVFFVAAATALSKRAIAFTMVVLALLVTVIFLVTTLKLYWRVIWLIEEYRIKWPSYARYLTTEGLSRERWGRLSQWCMRRLIPGEGQPKPPTWLDTGSLFTWGLGLVFLVGWIVMGVLVLAT